jgi:hypothetical protein
MNAVVRNIGIIVGLVGFSATIWFTFVPTPVGSVVPASGIVESNLNACTNNTAFNNRNIGSLIGPYRQSVGLSFLGQGGQYGAKHWVNDMQQNHFVGLVDSTGQDITQYAQANGVQFTNIAMLIYAGCPGNGNQLNGNNVIQAWLANPTCAAVLNYPNWTDIDYASGFYTSGTPNAQSGYWLEVVVFRQQ